MKGFLHWRERERALKKNLSAERLMAADEEHFALERESLEREPSRRTNQRQLVKSFLLWREKALKKERFR